MSLLNRLIGAGIGLVPRPIVGRMARRYVAGETLDEGLAQVEKLQEEGCCATFDLLGEFIRSLDEAEATVAAYLRILDRIARDGVDSNVSIKLTAFGLLLDENAALRNARRVVERARDHGNSVRLDMEDSPCHDATFRIYRGLRACGLDNVGIVLQACMRRGLGDIEALADLRPSVRLCKGIYVEPESLAFLGFEEIRRNYIRMLEALFDAGCRVGIATHDPWLVDEAERILRARNLQHGAYEFQMLLGVAQPLRRRLVAGGHPLRVYVPFGRDWYAYCVRRLKENPAIARHALKAVFRRS